MNDDVEGCSCHINAPCSWCVDSRDCEKCYDFVHMSEFYEEDVDICIPCVLDMEKQEMFEEIKNL